MALPSRLSRSRAAPAPPPSGHPDPQREVPASTHRRQHLQPVTTHPHRCPIGHPVRCRRDYPRLARLHGDRPRPPNPPPPTPARHTWDNSSCPAQTALSHAESVVLQQLTTHPPAAQRTTRLLPRPPITTQRPTRQDPGQRHQVLRPTTAQGHRSAHRPTRPIPTGGAARTQNASRPEGGQTLTTQRARIRRH